MSIEFNNLKLFRKQNGFTQEEVAEKLNVSRQTVAKWESGETIPDIENCIALADIYGTTVDMLVRNLTEVSYTIDGNFIKTHSSAKTAAIAVGLKRGSSIGLVCRGERKSAKGFLWKYHNEMSDK